MGVVVHTLLSALRRLWELCELKASLAYRVRLLMGMRVAWMCVP